VIKELITVAVCCGNVSNLIGRRTINIPEIIFGVHAFSVSTVRAPVKPKVNKAKSDMQNFKNRVSIMQQGPITYRVYVPAGFDAKHIIAQPTATVSGCYITRETLYPHNKL